METNIHYPTESSLLYDGLRSIISDSLKLASEFNVPGWRQHFHLLKQVKKLHRQINRIATKKGPRYKDRIRPFYRKLLQKSALITERARSLCQVTDQPAPSPLDLFGSNTLQAFIVRTERVASTATRRILNNETVPHSDKLFSIFEPHTQLYKRGKAGQPMQFGRQVLVFEDAAGFLVRGVVMKRDEGDKDVALRETEQQQANFGNRVKRLSFDRGFQSPENQIGLSRLVEHVCLPKPGAKQSVAQLAAASDSFHAEQQNHPGVESTIGALQSGNALKRCRDHSEIGCERYLQLAILGRNLHALGRMFIAKEDDQSAAAKSKRRAA